MLPVVPSAAPIRVASRNTSRQRVTMAAIADQDRDIERPECGLAGQQYGGGEGAGTRQQRDRERERRDVADMLLARLLGVAGLPLDTHPQHHFGRDREQEKPASDAERRQRDAKLAQQPVADQSGAGQDRAGDNGGAQRHVAACRIGNSGRHRQKCRCKADRVDHHEEGDRRGDEIFERHGSPECFGFVAVALQCAPIATS